LPFYAFVKAAANAWEQLTSKLYLVIFSYAEPKQAYSNQLTF